MGKSKPAKDPKAASAPSARSRKTARTKTVPPGVGEACGISAFAVGLGADEDFTAAVICSVLTGIAGVDTLIQAPWGASRLPKLDVLVSKEDLPASRLIDCLTTPLELLNRRLTQNMARAHGEAVENLVRGAFNNDAPKGGRTETGDTTLRRNLELLTPLTAGGLQVDLHFDPLVQRREAVLHPRVLVIKAAGRNLPALVAGCHGCSALVVEPNLGLDREGSEPAQVIRELLPLLDGAVSPDPGGSRAQPRSNSELTRAQLILSLGREEREALPGVGSPLLDRLLWLRGDGTKPAIPSKFDNAALFFEAYQTVIEEIVGLRREGRSLMAGFESAETCRRFYMALRAYESEVTALKSRPGISVIGLPQTLFLGLWFLRRSLPGVPEISDESLTAYVFKSARRMAAIHDAQVLELRASALVNDRKLIARRVVEKLEMEKAPLKLRPLARLFNNPKKERIVPVLDALVEAGVLLKSESDHYELGPVDLDEVGEVLVEKFNGKANLDL